MPLNNLVRPCRGIFNQSMRLVIAFPAALLGYKLFVISNAQALPEGDWFHGFTASDWYAWLFRPGEIYYVLTAVCVFYLFSFPWVRRLRYVSLSVWSVFVGIDIAYIIFPFNRLTAIEFFLEKVHFFPENYIAELAAILLVIAAIILLPVVAMSILAKLSEQCLRLAKRFIPA